MHTEQIDYMEHESTWRTMIVYRKNGGKEKGGSSRVTFLYRWWVSQLSWPLTFGFVIGWRRRRRCNGAERQSILEELQVELVLSLNIFLLSLVNRKEIAFNETRLPLMHIMTQWPFTCDSENSPAGHIISTHQLFISKAVWATNQKIALSVADTS